MTEDSPAIRLTDIVTRLRRRWRVIALTVGVCVALAMVFAFLQPRTYTAVSVLTVNPIAANPFGGASGTQEVNITTERAVVQSTEVAEAAREIIGSTADPRDLVERIDVTSPTDALILEIEAQAGRAEEAAATANAFAEAYLATRTAAATDVDDRTEKIDERIAELTAQLSQSVDDPELPVPESIQREIDGLRDMRSELTATVIDPGRVITSAAPPRNESSLGLPIFAAGGLAVGLLAGVGVALARERFDSRVGNGTRLSGVIALPVLEEHGQSGFDDLLNRLVIRLDLDPDLEFLTVGVVGADGPSSDRVSRRLSSDLTAAGYRALFVPWGDRSPAELEGGLVNSVRGDQQGADPVRVVVISASAEEGIGRTAMLAQRLDKVVVTTSSTAKMEDVTELVEEIGATGAGIDAVVAVRTSGRAVRTSGRRADRRPRNDTTENTEPPAHSDTVFDWSGDGPPADPTIRFRPVSARGRVRKGVHRDFP
ncbi:hypothetical protein GCM10009676_40420 [Prauserella halophila]|uniref:Polysaccharide chain length determinant N-terminal domain-containing protein n=1 Tax=Prauserella halophila TaxID=185641 RepID=A0ABP4H5Y5_9PSEU|nr:Wzz/FepE/Etk N-terminal domain-containing protein [Prauserella halophila]MCP2236795.1 Capsular polysaccharide biosynthesis protein [Prauserella halophila]